MITKILLASVILAVIPFLPQATSLPTIMLQAIDFIVGSLLLFIKLFPGFADIKIIAEIALGIVIAEIVWYYTQKLMTWMFS